MKETPNATDFAAATRYNEWLDLQYSDQKGELEILGFKPRPSEVLHRFSYDTYEASFADFKQAREEEIRQSVTNEFPIIIAHPFSRFSEGAEHEVQRLQFLRDTWEGLISFVHALVVSEARSLKIPLVEPIKFASLFSDSIAARLTNIQEILKLAAKNGVALECSKIIELNAVGTIVELNRTRNAFSHCGAVSEAQATNFIGECIEDVYEVLDAFETLRNVCLLRYDKLDGCKLRHERFDGHSKTRRYTEMLLTPQTIAAATPLLAKGETLIYDSIKLFSARPFLHLVPKTGGHVTEVAFFKKTLGDAPNRKILFELVGESQSLELDRKLFQPAINEIRTLFNLTPE